MDNTAAFINNTNYLQNFINKELIIQQRFNSLRQIFNDLIYQNLHIYPPKDLLNRYIMIKFNNINCNIVESISKDLSMSIPIRLQQNYSRYDSQKIQEIHWKIFNKIQYNLQFLYRYAKQQEKDQLNKFNDDVQMLSPQQTRNPQQQLQNLQSLVQKIIDFNMKYYENKFKEIISKLDQEFINLGNFYPKNIHEAKEQDIQIINQQNQILTDKNQINPNSKYFVKYNAENIEISSENLFKLTSNNNDDFNSFKTHLFVMLLRYQSYQGNAWKPEKSNFINKSEGVNLQARVYQKLMNKLNEKFDIKTEMFASPINCQFEIYFSQFRDTDEYFQSKGSSFNLLKSDQQLEKIVECNPPFTEELLYSAGKMMIQLLEKKRTNVVIFICPSWRQDCALYHQLLDQTEYKYSNIYLKPNSYKYSCGGVGNDQGSFTGTFGSEYYILCNNDGKEQAQQVDIFIRNFEHYYQ